jgi:hypothetical protein
MKQRQEWVELIERFVGLPLKGNEEQWKQFMQDVVRLPLDYLTGVRRTVDARVWRGKCEPVAWIHKVAPLAIVNLPDPPAPAGTDPRTLVPVPRGHVPEPTDEDKLRFDFRRRRRVSPGSIADLKPPVAATGGDENGEDLNRQEPWTGPQGVHDGFCDLMTAAAGEEEEEKDWIERVPARYRLAEPPPDSPRARLEKELLRHLLDIRSDDISHRIDWDLLAADMGLREGSAGRYCLPLAIYSSEYALLQDAPTEAERKRIQRGFRQLRRIGWMERLRALMSKPESTHEPQQESTRAERVSTNRPGGPLRPDGAQWYQESRPGLDYLEFLRKHTLDLAMKLRSQYGSSVWISPRAAGPAFETDALSAASLIVDGSHALFRPLSDTATQPPH